MNIDLFLTDEHRMLREMVRRFAEEDVIPRAAQIDRDDEFPRDLYEKMGDLGLLGVMLPEEAGGGGMDTISQVIVQEELARGSAVMANAQTGPIEVGFTLWNHAPKDLIERYLPGVLSGRVIPASALTEPGAGSDAASIQTTAVRDGDHFRINGSKTFATSGTLADFVIVYAKTDPAAGSRGISAILVDKSTPGLTVGAVEELHGVRGLGTSGFSLQDCRVPTSCLIGEEGRGLRMSFNTFDLGRISTAAMAIGIAQAAFEHALAYAHQRIQFGKPIFEFQAVQFKLADMATELDAARLLTLHAAQLRDKQLPFVREASEAKMFASDMGARVTDSAMMILGGYGYTKQYPVERFCRDARLPQIFEGTNNIQHLIIARELSRSLTR